MIALEVISPSTRRLQSVASSVPIGQRGLAHIWGRNDTSVTQDLGIVWVVRAPDGNVVEEYSDWSYGHGPGDDHEFIGGRFDLDMEGTYTLAVDLLMNPGDPVVVDSYYGDLCTTTTEVPPEYEPIQHTIYPFAYIYAGDIEVTTATFQTDPFTPSAWMADEFASKLEEEVRARGGRPLEIKVAVDKTPLLWTDFRIEVSSTPLGGVTEAAPGIAVGIALWLAIVLVCLAITLVIVVATLAFKTIMAEFKRYPGLHEVKPAWEKDTLILTIQDAEEYWERPLTPVGTLEEMSEEDLREYLDQIAEEEVPPVETSPWAIVVLVAGVGVLGVGAAVALSMARPGK